jgi:hypothetical protein
MMPRPYWFQPATRSATRFLSRVLGMNGEVSGFAGGGNPAVGGWRIFLNRERNFA